MCQVRKKNVLKDFVAVAGPLGVTHFIIFNKTPSSVNMVHPACCWTSIIQWICLFGNTFHLLLEACSTSQRPDALLQSAEGTHVIKRKTIIVDMWAQMMICSHLIEGDIFKVNALRCSNYHPESSTVPAWFPNEWAFCSIPSSKMWCHLWRNIGCMTSNSHIIPFWSLTTLALMACRSNSWPPCFSTCFPPLTCTRWVPLLHMPADVDNLLHYGWLQI